MTGEPLIWTKSHCGEKSVQNTFEKIPQGQKIAGFYYFEKVINGDEFWVFECNSSTSVRDGLFLLI